MLIVLMLILTIAALAGWLVVSPYFLLLLLFVALLYGFERR